MVVRWDRLVSSLASTCNVISKHITASYMLPMHHRAILRKIFQRFSPSFSGFSTRLDLLWEVLREFKALNGLDLERIHTSVYLYEISL